MDLVCNLLSYRNNFKVYHWSTGSFSRHKATCDLVDKMDELIDTIIETYSARYGVPKGKCTLSLEDLNDTQVLQYLDSFIAWVTKEFPTFVHPSRDFDLLNTRDELLGVLEQTKYLFRLK